MKKIVSIIVFISILLFSFNVFADGPIEIPNIELDDDYESLNIDDQENIRTTKVDGNETYLIGQYHYINKAKYMMGNVSGDNRINSRDALMVLKHSAGIETLADPLDKVADVDFDGKVTASDALIILKYSVKMFSADDMDIKPTAEPEPTPTVPVPTWINSENANEHSVDGLPVEIDNLNGAIEYSNDPHGVIYEFTDENKNNNTGIEIKNPIIDNSDLIHDYGYLYDVSIDGLINAFHLYGSKLGWGRDEEKLPNTADQLPSICDPRCIDYPATSEVYYPTVDIHKGFSMSFWSKADYKNKATPIIVFADEKQTLSVTLNAEANYTDSVVKMNRFITSQSVDKPNYISEKWHYYTITFANDWICVYIDGLEVPYDEVVLDREQMGAFNDGFLTRYNTAVSWCYEDYANDWRGYLSNQKGSHKDYPTITSDRYTLWGNSRYRGINSGGTLLLTFMTNKATKVYIGGADVAIASESAKYTSKSGSQVAQIEYYLDELNWEQVYANYLLAKEPVDIY